MAVRLAIVALAAAAIVLLGSRLREHDRCQSAQTANPLRVSELTANCRDPDVLAGASVVLANAGRHQDGVRLARESVRREPESFSGWVAVALTASEPAQARRAVARAKALNPRWQGLPPAAAQGP